ncbi:LysE family translocator [Marinomonas sp. THO17]|uniref:LysE family translocator n=1 Tax=Marinomonas sp. THO17 TaxID=3149048 RepID=UPI00336C24DA
MGYVNHFECYSVAIITLLAVISPGPDFAMISKIALLQGRRAGILCALGIGTAISIHITYTLLGLGIVLANNAWVLNLLSWLGATYLIWLGLSALWPDIKRVLFRLDSADHSSSQTSLIKNNQPAFWSGFTCNALNPKTMLFIVSLFSQVISIESPLIVELGYGVYIALVHFIWFALVAFLLTAKQVKNTSVILKKWIERVSGGVLVAFGGALLAR